MLQVYFAIHLSTVLFCTSLNMGNIDSQWIHAWVAAIAACRADMDRTSARDIKCKRTCVCGCR